MQLFLLRVGVLTSMMLVIAILISGCARGPATIPVDYTAIWCSTNSPFRPSAAAIAALNRKEKELMVAHNEYGAANCGWKP